MKKVTVVGAGTMGSQIALQAAFSGRYRVALVDAAPGQLEKARVQNQKLVARQVEKGRFDAAEGERVLARIEDSRDLEAALEGSELVIEAVFEDFEVKQKVFQELGRLAPPGAVLASNSSTIAISRLAPATGRAQSCCNLHFFHPVTVMQLCEVVRGPETADDTIERAVEFVRGIDRVPVVLRKEVWGFIVNRILFAASEEALRLLEGGYASAEDIDLAVKKGQRAGHLLRRHARPPAPGRRPGAAGPAQAEGGGGGAGPEDGEGVLRLLEAMMCGCSDSNRDAGFHSGPGF